MKSVVINKEGYAFRRGEAILAIIGWDDERAGTEILPIIRDWVFSGILPE